MIFAAQHFHLRQNPLDLAPFHRQLQHPPQDFQLPVNAGDGESGLPTLRDERGDLVAGDRVEQRVRQRLELPQVLQADPVVFEGLDLVGETRFHERREIVVDELAQRRYRLPLPNADLRFG